MPRAIQSRLLVMCMLAVGVALLVWVPPLTGVRPLPTVLFATAIVLSFWPVVTRLFGRLHDGLERARLRTYILTTAAFMATVLAYLVADALLSDRPLFPYFHDEQMYLLQGRMLASGRVALPAHACAEFFDTFYVLVTPVYSSMYFPGTALAYVPAIAMGLPWIVWPLLITTVALLLVQTVSAEVLRSRLLGFVAVIGVLGVTAMGFVPTMTMSHTLATALGLGLIQAWLRWRQHRSLLMAALCGGLAGWMVISRPAEGVAFSVPVLLAVALSARPANWRQTLAHAGVAMACAAPFLALLMWHNHAVTGSLFKLPIQMYVEQEFVGLQAFAGDPTDASALRSTSQLLQKQTMFERFVLPTNASVIGETAMEGIRWRTQAILQWGLPDPSLYLLVPLALLALRDPPKRIVTAVAAMFLIVYLGYPNFAPQYGVQIAPILIIIVLAGFQAVEAAFPTYHREIRCSGVLSLVVAALAAIPTLPNQGYGGRELGALWFVRNELPARITGRALVLVKYDPRDMPDAEPVYNLEAAKVDDNRIVLAHDLGPAKNPKLFAYYADTQPDRSVYLLDRRSLTLSPMGNVQTLAANSTTGE